MKPSEILNELYQCTDYDIDLFFFCLKLGFESEWDCDIYEGIKNFSGKEIGLACKNASGWAEYHEDTYERE